MNNDPDKIKLTRLAISRDEMDYLSQRWEVRDHKELFVWAIQLLHDLSKLDEEGWMLSLVKGTFNQDNKKVNLDQGYKSVHFKMEWLGPKNEEYMRLPKPEMLEKFKT